MCITMRTMTMTYVFDLQSSCGIFLPLYLDRWFLHRFLARLLCQTSSTQSCSESHGWYLHSKLGSRASIFGGSPYLNRHVNCTRNWAVITHIISSRHEGLSQRDKFDSCISPQYVSSFHNTRRVKIIYMYTDSTYFTVNTLDSARGTRNR